MVNNISDREITNDQKRLEDAVKWAIKNPLKLDLIYGALNASQKKSYGLSDRNKM